MRIRVVLPPLEGAAVPAERREGRGQELRGNVRVSEETGEDHAGGVPGGGGVDERVGGDRALARTGNAPAAGAGRGEQIHGEGEREGRKEGGTKGKVGRILRRVAKGKEGRGF